MECNKDEATRAKEIAESKFSSKDLNGAKKFALKAQNLFPGLEDDDIVKKHYRKLALSLHPDKNKSVGAEGAFQLVSQTWNLLSDKDKRLAYDHKRNAQFLKQRVDTQNVFMRVHIPPTQNGFHNVLVATMIGTLVAYLIVPMRSLGQDSWKIASALIASYIGGAINYVAVSDALAVSPSVIAAGVSADNVICAIYFMVLFALGSKLPTEASPLSPANRFDSGSGDNTPVLQTATALAVSFAI
ncbi:ferric reduction oxidase 4 [Tanacetum coccineum]